ncbi:MAG: ABC transporter ATP-binding protein, partial [FCB group bacterium]
STESTILMVTHDWDTAFHHANYVLMLNRKQICFESPEKAFTADYLRQTFGHVGHKHDMIFGEMHHE